MNTPIRGIAAGLLIVLAAGCATPASRIEGHRAAFDSWPAVVQERIQAGQVAVGFTPEMVLVALGEPDRRTTRTTAAGTVEVWTYFDHGPHFSFGIGAGSAHGSSAVAGGVAVNDGGFRGDEMRRVIFDGGKVAAIESRK